MGIFPATGLECKGEMRGGLGTLEGPRRANPFYNKGKRFAGLAKKDRSVYWCKRRVLVFGNSRGGAGFCYPNTTQCRTWRSEGGGRCGAPFDERGGKAWAG